jgi:hypothetical protein
MPEAAMAGMESVMSMRLWESIQGEELLILTFLSHRIAAKFSGVTPVVKPFSVQVANETQLMCST